MVKQVQLRNVQYHRSQVLAQPETNIIRLREIIASQSNNINRPSQNKTSALFIGLHLITEVKPTFNIVLKIRGSFNKIHANRLRECTRVEFKSAENGGTPVPVNASIRTGSRGSVHQIPLSCAAQPWINAILLKSSNLHIRNKVASQPYLILFDSCKKRIKN